MQSNDLEYSNGVIKRLNIHPSLVGNVTYIVHTNLEITSLDQNFTSNTVKRMSH